AGVIDISLQQKLLQMLYKPKTPKKGGGFSFEKVAEDGLDELLLVPEEDTDSEYSYFSSENETSE
ncbi:MAG: hypothetical protein LBM16_03250, partial [Clostridiales bacterium]|nr:hypothetical protein [Clostridiales bacterium]